MIDITPNTDGNSQVTQGDKVRVRWILDGQVNKDDLTFTIYDYEHNKLLEFSGNNLTEKTVTIDGDKWYRYYVDFELPEPHVKIDYRLADNVNFARDTGELFAFRKIT